MNVQLKPSSRPDHLNQPNNRQSGPPGKPPNPGRTAGSAFAADAPSAIPQRIANLLVLEMDLRKCASKEQLIALIANETHKVLECQQVAIFELLPSAKMVGVTSLSQIDPTSPVVRWMEHNIAGKKQGLTRNISAPVNTIFLDVRTAPQGHWPFPHILPIWIAGDNGAPAALVCLFSNQSFEQKQLAMAERLKATYTYHWRQLEKKSLIARLLKHRKFHIALGLLVLTTLFIPVPMSVLAPLEIVAQNPQIIAAPLNGVIDKIQITPGAHVIPGQLLVSYIKTDFENDLKNASEEADVVRTKYLRASQNSFGQGEGRRELSEIRGELELAQSKLQFSRQQLARSEIRADREGIALLGDTDDWIGRPVKTGERILEIADPKKTEANILLPLSESIVLAQAKSATLFLDSQPLNPLAAKIIRRSFHAQMQPNQTMAYPLIARFGEDLPSTTQYSPRIGVRGTAKLNGAPSRLGFVLFRKPIAAMRQYLGI